jgi:hypothetical protein
MDWGFSPSPRDRGLLSLLLASNFSMYSTQEKICGEVAIESAVCTAQMDDSKASFLRRLISCGQRQGFSVPIGR